MLASFKLRWTASRVESANSRRNALSAVKVVSQIEEDLSNALMAVSGKATGAMKQKVSIIESELMDELKQGSTHIEMESQATILGI